MLRPGDMVPGNDSVKATADRHFAEQCRRLGPISGDARPAPKQRSGRALRTSLDRLSKRTLEPV